VSPISFSNLKSTLTTPLPSTSTYTPEATVTVFNKRRRGPLAAPQPTLEARQVTVVPTSIPAYASPCSGSVRYSSACSCIGVTATVTTAATPTTVVTAATATTTIVEGPVAPHIDFTGYNGASCTDPNLGPGSFVNGECVELPDQFNLEDDALNPGTCADTSGCVLYLFNFGGCESDELINTITDLGPACVYVEDALYGQLVCPNC
jgi:hypothetical protein